MPQIFHRSANTIARVSIFGALFFVAGLLYLAYQIDRSPWVTQVNVAREQPIQFSHERHVAGNGIDCRYCHTTVETSSFAGIPPTKTCMNCHSQIFADAAFLEPVRESFRTDRADCMDARPRSARLRVLRPQHPRRKGRRLLDMPRPGRQDAADAKAELAADGMVPRLPQAPRALRAAARRGLQHELRGARQPARAGTKARGRESHPEDDGLQRMSPMKPSSQARQRARVLADARRTTGRQPRRARRRRVRVAAARAVRRGRAPLVSEIDGGVARARGHGRLHAPAARADSSVRAPARKRRSGQAAVLRNRDDARRPRDRAARREPRRTADENRRQPVASRQPRRNRCLRAGGTARSLRSRSHADADAHGRDLPVVGVHRRDAHGLRRRSRRRKAPASAS